MRTPDLNWLKDSRIFQVNRLQAYSDHIYTMGKDGSLTPLFTTDLKHSA